MEEQSDTPRTDWAAREAGGSSSFAALGWRLARALERELAAVTRERDEARALNAQWAEKAAAWFASPEAAQRFQGYRDLAQQVATAQNERDEARAEVERLRSAVRWACGYDEGAPHFDPPEGAPRYWWRAELMRRAALAATEPKP